MILFLILSLKIYTFNSKLNDNCSCLLPGNLAFEVYPTSMTRDELVSG